MAKPKQPPGPAMTLGNMRELGVQAFSAYRGFRMSYFIQTQE
jgi:hypothetical protein